MSERKTSKTSCNSNDIRRNKIIFQDLFQREWEEKRQFVRGIALNIT